MTDKIVLRWQVLEAKELSHQLHIVGGRAYGWKLLSGKSSIGEKGKQMSSLSIKKIEKVLLKLRMEVD